MKRVLSLIVAIVMVALMLPVAFVTTMADEEVNQGAAAQTEFPYLLKMPEGWAITRDDLAGVKNQINASGITLGSASQSIAMTTKVGVGQKRVITVDFGVPTKLNVLQLTWEANKPVSGAALQEERTAGTGGNDLFLCVLGGPQQRVTDGASWGMKASVSESAGGWFNADGQIYVKTPGAESYSAPAAIKRWTAGNVMKADSAEGKISENGYGWIGETLYDGACTNNGMKMTLYVEIDENNYVTGAYIQTITVDGEGNLKQESVIYYANATGYQISCDGYLTIGHSGWGENTSLLVKSVSINAGTAKEMGEVLHSTDFQAWGAANVDAHDYIVPEKDKAYTDSADTYYQDGYLLHFTNFAKITDWSETNYSFATNTLGTGNIKIENNALKVTTADTDAYLLLTGNAIPQAITEYTAKYTFRFVGVENSSFGFIRGATLNDNGTIKAADVVDIAYDGTVADFATTDDVWDDIVTSMGDGEWVDVVVSSVGRHVEYITITCGYNTATLKMDTSKNRAAVDGYMGFVFGKGSAIELYSVTVIAGMDSKVEAYTWPAGVTMGELIQDVAAEAVIDAAKPDYSDIIDVLNGTKAPEVNNPDNGPSDVIDDPDPSQTTSATTTTAAKDDGAKKGCKGSIVALPAIIATAIFGCAVVCKKKED